MLSREKLLRLIRESVDDLNAERQDGSHIEFDEGLRLFGVGSPLDSLDFVTFTVGLQDRLRLDAGVSLDLAPVLLDDEAGQPFRSVAALTEYLLELHG